MLVPGLDGMRWNVPYLFYFIRSYLKSYQHQCKLIYKMVYWRSIITKLERRWGGNPFPQKRENSLQVIDVQLEGGNLFPQKRQNSLQVIDVQLVWHLTSCKVMKLIIADKILLLVINNNLLTNMLNCPWILASQTPQKSPKTLTKSRTADSILILTQRKIQ